MRWIKRLFKRVAGLGFLQGKKARMLAFELLENGDYYKAIQKAVEMGVSPKCFLQTSIAIVNERINAENQFLKGRLEGKSFFKNPSSFEGKSVTVQKASERINNLERLKQTLLAAKAEFGIN